MRKSLMAVAAVTMLMGPRAFAADMALKAPPPPPPVISWTGCYVDAGGGYGFWKQNHSITGPFGAGGATATTVTTTDGGSGWLGRFGGGCDYQTPIFNNRVVVGAFADYDPMSLSGSNSPSEVFAFMGGAYSPVTANMKETGAWYAGARAGYLLTPSLLTYIDGGYTRTRFTQTGEFQTATGTPIGFGYPNFNDGGWFIGSGFEYALSDWIPIRGLFLQTEYRYSQYSSRSLAEYSLTTGIPDGNVETTRPYVQTITTALVWRFNWPGSPVSTRY